MLPYWSRRNSTIRILFSRLPTMSAVCIVVRRPCFSLQFFQQKQKDCTLYISSSIFFSASPFINPWTYASPTSSELFPRGRMMSGVLHPNRIATKSPTLRHYQKRCQEPNPTRGCQNSFTFLPRTPKSPPNPPCLINYILATLRSILFILKTIELCYIESRKI